MPLFNSSIKNLIEQKDFAGLQQLLTSNPSLANEGITIPFQFFCNTKEHPLHRLCDAVFSGNLTNDEAISMAKIFLENGSNIDGYKKNGTPLIAAASLHAEQLGLFYIDCGADIHFADTTDKASALHWAAFCGRDKLVAKLIEKGAQLNELDQSFGCTPLAWAIHAYWMPGDNNKHHQPACISILLQAGADIKKLSAEHWQQLYIMKNQHSDIKACLPSQDN